MVRAILTAACFVLFVGIVVWAFGPGRRERFAQAARLPLDDEREEPR